jgi:putative ABC transport system permease protein
MQSLTPGYRSTKYPVRIKDSQPIKDRKVGSFFPYGTGMFSGFMMIVPDNYFKTIKSESSDTFYGWDVKGSDKLSKNFIKQLDKKKNHYLLNVHVGSSLDDSYLTKQAAVPLNQLKVNDYLQAGYLRQADAKSIMRKATGLFLFLVSIFSVALLIALGSLLTLKVLLRDDYEWRQLKTLKKIGMTNQELKQIVKRETKFLFAIPMTFALIQSFLVVGVANLSVNQPTFIPFLLIGIAYLVLYGLVGFLTYILSWRGVRQKIN